MRRGLLDLAGLRLRLGFVHMGTDELVRLLIKAGAKPNDVTNNGDSPLHYAAYMASGFPCPGSFIYIYIYYYYYYYYLWLASGVVGFRVPAFV